MERKLYDKIGFHEVNEHIMEVNGQQIPFYKMVIKKMHLIETIEESNKAIEGGFKVL